MILDTTYVFFILNETVYSQIYETGNKGTVSACKYLRYESKLSKQNINSAFNYFVKWWNYDPEYSKSIPNKNNLYTDIQRLLSSNNEYSKIIDAIIIIRSEIFNEKYDKTEKSNLFEKNARIIGMSENKIPLNNPFSDDYDELGDLDNIMSFGYENIQLDIEAQQLDIRNKQLDIELAEAKARVEKSIEAKKKSKKAVLEAARKYVATGGNLEDIEGWNEFAKRLNITSEDLK